MTMWNLFLAFFLILSGVYLMINVGGFLGLWLSFVLIWWGFNRLEGLNQLRYRKHEAQRANYEGNEYGAFRADHPNYLIHYLKKRLANQPPANILAGVLSSVCIHIAKIDGRISEQEISSLRQNIMTKFPQVDHDFVRTVVSVTKDHLDKIGTANIYNSSIDIIGLYFDLIEFMGESYNEYLNSLIFGFIYEVAIADGQVHPLKEDMFNRICNFYSIPHSYREEIKRNAWFNYNARRGHYYHTNVNTESEKFKIALNFFQLSPKYDSTELEKAWKKTALAYHPDRYNNEPTKYKEMNEKFIEAKDNYELLKQYLSRTRPS